MDTFSTAPWVDILIFLGMVLALGGALFLARQLFVDTSETVEQTSGTGSPVPAEPVWGESSDFFRSKEELGNTGLMGNLKNMFNRDKTPVKPIEEISPEPLEKEIPKLEVKAKSEDFRREDPFAELQRKVKESTMIAEEYEKPIENKAQIDAPALKHSVAVVEESETEVVLDTDSSIREAEAQAEQKAEAKRLAEEAETARKEAEAEAKAEQEAEAKRLAAEETARKEAEAKAEQEAEARRLAEEERRKAEEEEARRLLEAKELTRQREEEEARRIAEEKAERLQKLEETPKEVVEEPLEKLVEEVLAQGEGDKGDWEDLDRTKKKEDKQDSVSDKLAKLLGIAKPPKIEKFNQPLIQPEEEKLVDAKGAVGESIFVSDQPGRIDTSQITEEQIRRRKPRLIPDEVAILSADQLRIALVNTGGAMVYLGHDSGKENQLEINMMPPPIPEKGLDGPLFVKGARLSFSMRGSEVEEKGYQFKIRFQDEVGVEYYQEIAGRGKDIPFITRPVKA